MPEMKKAAAIVLLLIAAIAAAAVWRTPRHRYILGIAAIMKNEKPYLKEWLEYHLLQGVEHFYLCDNGSTDGTETYLAPYIESGMITYIKLPGVNQQLACYEKIVAEYKHQAEWLAIIDLDEYLVPLKAPNMPEFLKEFSDVAEVSLHWMNYGNNGAFFRPDGLSAEFFTAHARFLNHTVKSIVRPEKVIGFKAFGSNHYIRVNGRSVNEYHKPVSFMLDFNISADKARINHYITRSFAEFAYKKGRGHPEGTPIDYSYYFFHNENDVKGDTSMLRFLPELKRRMRRSPLADVSLPRPEDLPESFADFYFTPEEASQVLERKISEPMGFYEIEEAYKNRQYPSYLPFDEK